LGYRKDKTTMTIENFAMWELGTVFFYYDITEPTTNDGNSGDSASRRALSTGILAIVLVEMLSPISFLGGYQRPLVFQKFREKMLATVS
jgi:hypothetical protein